MHLKPLSLSLALAAITTLATAYPISGNNVNCRSSPSTTSDVVTTYAKGTDVSLECQTHGETVLGTSLWSKTTDGCYVTDYYVKTGTTGMVTDACPDDSDSGGDGGSSGDSSYQGSITRSEILKRGKYWTDRGIPYSMEAEYPDAQGRNYRTDCSGFVSMALHAWAPGYGTVNLGDVAEAITWGEIQAGDFVGTLGAGTGGAAGHVVIFTGWVDSSKEEFHTLECRGTYGCEPYKREKGFKVGGFTAKPYKYVKVKEE
ncbi:hypothetical protein BJY04DRAFT_213698 [Aspergillus karnatakaensis]|uniref:putative NlpC/P60-like cell-wall peptidase n=1 Tax=Aspergillus karnatakaensis TaxID=1810916 RepID=UPI003CCDE529